MRSIQVQLIIFCCVLQICYGFPNVIDVTVSPSSKEILNDPCLVCEEVAGNILSLRKSNANRDVMKDYLYRLCKKYTDWGALACKGYVDIELDTVLYIIDNRKNLTPARFCSIRLQTYKCVDPEADAWSIPLPPPPPPSVINTDHKNSSESVQILHLTDIHYDPLYTPGSNAKCDEPLSCESGVPAKPEDAAGYWGDYNVCDVPWHSIENLMTRIKEKHKKIDWIYFTGDIVSHRSWTTSIDSNSDAIRTVLQLFAKTFPNKTVFPILGNHEPHPGDYFASDTVAQKSNVSTHWIFDFSAEEWSRWLPNNTQATIKKGGYYTVLVKPGFRIVALNSNVCFTSNIWLLYDDKDPYNQLQWLVDVLAEAEKNGERVHILSHIPPGETSCHRQWSHELKKIILRFSDTIAAQFNGHTHMDEFRLFFPSANSTEVKSVAYNGASFTTFIGSNPNYRIYEVNNNNMVIILLIVVFMRKQVDFLADLFKETSKCIMHLPGLFFQPLLTFVILTVFFMFWVFVVLCLATASYPGTAVISGVPVEGQPTVPFTTPTSGGKKMDLSLVEQITKFKVVEYIDASWIKGMWWVYFIGLIWTSEFIMACQQMVIAGAVAHWFYRHKYKSNDHVCYSIGKLIKYHLGSVALGSLIITIFKIPRLILMYLHERFVRNKEKGSECASCGLKCCICCFYCLEKFIRYLNHNAYTVIAIDGSNFCKAAGMAFEVLTSHALQIATINSLGDFILFLGKCFVTAVTGCVGLAIFRRNPELTFYAAPTLLVCVFAFFVAHCVLSLYEMVLDTVYLCMCQSGDAPDGIQMQNLGVTNNGNTQPQNTELEPMN